MDIHGIPLVLHFVYVGTIEKPRDERHGPAIHWKIEAYLNVSFEMADYLLFEKGGIGFESIQWFVACGALENEFHGVFERNPPTSKGPAIVKVVIVFILQSCLQLFEHSPFLIDYEAFELVWLKAPMENEPTSVLISRSSQSHKRVIIEFVEDSANRVEAYSRSIGDFVISCFTRLLQGVDDLDCLFFAKSLGNA